MTLYEIKTAVATYFKTTIADLTQNSQDLFLVAANQVRRQAELMHDFEFSRKLVTVSVNGVTGGSLEDAVVYGTSTEVNIKTVVEAGLFDTDGNLRPVEWTTVAEGIERQRIDNDMATPRYPTDSWFTNEPAGYGRFEMSGGTIYRWPKDLTHNFTLGLEVYTMSDDWTSSAESSVTVASAGTAGYNGNYTSLGLFNGKTLYYREATPNSYFIFYSASAGRWHLQLNELEDGVAPGYQSATSTAASPPAATWSANAASGTAVVTLSTVSDTWTTHASQYLMWGIIVHLNYYYKEFVLRQEGNLGSPEKLRDEALAAFMDWDAYRYEQNRRHGR